MSLAGGGALSTARLAEGSAAGALTPAQVACDEARVEAVLGRLTVSGVRGGAAPGFNLALTPSGGFAGVAYGGAPGAAERLLAFSAELAAELPQDPAQPLLPALRLARRTAGSDAVPSRDPGRLRLVFDPAPGAAALFAIDDAMGGAAVATGLGGGIADLAAPCHPPLAARDAHVLALLTRLARAAAPGGRGLAVAVLRDTAPDAYRLNVYPLGADGRPLGRLAARLAVAYDASGALAGGTLAVAPPCAPAAPAAGCTDTPLPTTLALVRPSGAGAPRSTVQVAVAGGGGGAASTPPRAVDWRRLLAGTAWGHPPAAAPPPARATVGPAPAAVLPAADADCDRARLEELLARLAPAAPPGVPAGVNLALADGGFAGLAFAGGAAGPERRLAFTADSDGLSPPRDPAQPLAGGFDLAGDALGSNLRAPRDPGLGLFLAPAGAARGACHPGFAARDAHLLALLVRLLRVEAAGSPSVSTAVFRAGTGYAIEAFPAGSGTAGRIAAYLDEISWDGAGRLAAGRLRFAPRCPAAPAADGFCTAFAGAASIGFLRPAAPGADRGETAFALQTSPTSAFGALDAEAAVDFGALLAGSTWRSPAPVAPRPLAEELALGPVLWVGAHPDDELLAAPLLGEVCRGRGARCTFLVATRGERGGCVLPGGCRPDVATVRTAEMRAAAAIFGAGLTQGSFPDGSAGDPGAVLAHWAATLGAGGGGGDLVALRATFAAFVARVRPQAIVTFDLRHGSTCHPDHRAVGRLVTETLAGLGAAAPFLYYLETRAGIEAGGGVDFRIAEPADPALRLTEASATWPYLEADAAAHASQFSPARRAALAAVPPAARRIALLPADDAIFLAGGYAALCQ